MINNETKIKTPCCAVLGHVDVGKTKLLDYMRKTKTSEASGITQQIGTTLYNRDRLEKLIGSISKTKIGIDSLLMIDTPGHECFDTIRYVALMVSDVVILMVDVIKGLEKQTVHIISLLQKHNVPFIICANKIDRIYGWIKPKSGDNLNLSNVIKRQSTSKADVIARFNDYVTKLQYSLYEHEVQSELYYQNKSPQDAVHIVPISAETGEGIPDLIMLISVMAEKRYLEDEMMKYDVTYGYVLDTHYDAQFGRYFVALHRNGKIKRGDTVNIGTREYNIKHILTNLDNKEIKDDHRFMRAENIDRSEGYGLVLDTEDSIEPSSIYYLKSDQHLDRSFLQTVQPDYEAELNILCKKGEPGIQVVAPSHIMMAGLLHILDKRKEPNLSRSPNKLSKIFTNVERYKVGKIDKIDIMISGKWSDRLNKFDALKNSIILSYDPATEHLSKELTDLAQAHKVTIIHSNVVYKLFEEYESYIESINQKIESLNVKPTASIKLIPKFIFRTTNPMIFGINVLNGTIKINQQVFSDEKLSHLIGTIKSIQKDHNTYDSAKQGDEVCIKIDSTKHIGKDLANDSVLWI